MEEGLDVAPSLDALLSQKLDVSGTSVRRMKCCCGLPACAFLKHNTEALEDLEKDLVSAAQIGQALLVRHETHLVDAEKERERMQSTMDQLEVDKRELESLNAKTIEENRDLLDQLEGLNNMASESDTQIEALAATLQSTQLELQRLTVLANRAETLDKQLTDLEVEQSQLQLQLKSSTEDNRSAFQRWKRAEGTIGHLQEQIDRIEKEAKEERERHVEVMGRLERRRIVEKELENAAGRLKGAAAMNSMNKQDGGNNVVSHFVKDILQDNSNLQTGILELREMLMGSNTEVENLRQQLELHQPFEDNQQTLRAELTKVEPDVEIEHSTAEPRSELHVHHHYHGPEITVKKPRKKRPVLTAGHFTGSGASTPRQKVKDWRVGTPTPSDTILSQTSASVPPSRPQNQNHRWSTQSTNSFAPSSVPSSPPRSSSIFDIMDNAFDSSRPTTPESSVPESPAEFWKDAHPPRKSAYRSISTPTQLQSTAIAESSELVSIHTVHETQLEEFDEPSFSDSPLAQDELKFEDGGLLSPAPERSSEEQSTEDTTPTPSTPSYLDELSPHPLRRSNSHESLLSVSGMDIHTLRSRPSQMLIKGMGFSPRPSLSPAGSALKSTQPILTAETATARPSLTRDMDSRSLLAQRYGSSAHAGKSSNESTPKAGITGRVGGWISGKWGVTPTPSEGDLRQKVALDPLAALLRKPGVNQSGPIKGLAPPPKTPSQVVPHIIDDEALGEALSGLSK